jgi:hypothetical protein
MTPIELYLAGARTIREAITDPAVVEAWDQPSVLEEQTVGSLAGHLARTGTFIMDEVLDAGAAEGPADFTDVATFYATLLPAAEDPIHEGIRARGAALAERGSDDLAATIDDRMPAIEAQLRTLPGDHLLTVTGGNAMALELYLVTRVVEQVVHLDDLARSVARAPWVVPVDAYALAARAALDVALLRHDPRLVVRGLYRRGHAEAVLPAI